jgi:hypothetical protein
MAGLLETADDGGVIDVAGLSRAVSIGLEIGRRDGVRKSRLGSGIGNSAARQKLPG